MIARFIRNVVEQYLKALTAPEGAVLPPGFSSAAQIRGAVTQLVTLPFGTSYCVCRLRTLSAGEMPEANFIELAKQDAGQGAESARTRKILLNTAEECCQKALVEPSFAELERIILGEDKRAAAMRAEYKRLSAEIETIPDPTLRLERHKGLAKLEMSVGFFLPANFMFAVASWVYCLDCTDIKRITPQRLKEAWILSKRFHNRPSDNIAGIFLDYHRREIDALALTLNERNG